MFYTLRIKLLRLTIRILNLKLIAKNDTIFVEDSKSNRVKLEKKSPKTHVQILKDGSVGYQAQGDININCKRKD